MNDVPLGMFTFLNPIHYENIDLYIPSDEYHDIAESILPNDWKIKKKAFWTMCTPPDWVSKKHGWKIHVSSVPENALETIKIVAVQLEAAKVAFKFCSDPRMLKMSLRKTWSRFQAGKFIAIYPRDESEFTRLIDILHKATTDLIGPHVLTDRAYRDSRVVYYRYGAHAGEHKVDAYGVKIPGYTMDDDSWYEDIRGPFFRLPPGYTDPFSVEVSNNNQAPTEVMLNKRYLVKGALKFNATGGIYFGLDTHDGSEIIIREVRGMLGHFESEMPEDPSYILKREARILKKLESTGIVPKFIDLFQEWNNWFLVEERLDAESLWGKSMEFYYSTEYQSSSFGLDKIVSTTGDIARGLKTIHEHGIVLRDLTKNNLMFTAGGNVKFIDLEFAYEIEDSGQWVKGWTPGYASKEQALSNRPIPEDDCYALGALILDMLTFCASGLELGREAIIDKKLKQVLSDLSLPLQLYDIVNGLLDLDVNKRWNIEKVLFSLNKIHAVPSEIMMFPAKENLLNVDPPTFNAISNINQVNDNLQRYLDSTQTLSRTDQLWPGSPPMFITNPVSIQHGAAGVAWYLLRSRGHLDSKIIDWIAERASSTLCPPGLYSGLSGVALLSLYAGRYDLAQKQLNSAAKSELIFSSPGLYFGCSGWGLTNLHFWHHTKESRYLESAIQVGNWLLETGRESPAGICWMTGDKTYLGLGDGQSGIALFLTYLGAASKDKRFINAASKALNFDIAHGIRVAGRICWRYHVDSYENEPNLPHTRFGSAGVGTACLRYFALTGDINFKKVALDCAYSVRSRVTNKIWQDSGNAGIGEFWLDLEHFLGDEEYKNIAYYQAEAILPHALEYPAGTTFAGPDHLRVVSDYSTGAAGIGIFFDRLINKRLRFLMLDDLIKENAEEFQGASRNSRVTQA